VLVGAATLEGFTDQGVAFILDITERKEAEERVRMSERLPYEVFENSADALFLINAEGNIVERYNQQAVQLFDLEDNQKYVGLPAQDLQKHPFTEAQKAALMEQLAARDSGRPNWNTSRCGAASSGATRPSASLPSTTGSTS
jgi:PAS domain-containing protein